MTRNEDTGIMSPNVTVLGAAGVIGGAVAVEVAGAADGVPTVHRFAGTSTMEGATSTAASVGAQFVLDSRLEAEAGVYPPETAIPPDAYVDRLVDEPGFEFWSGRFEKRA